MFLLDIHLYCPSAHSTVHPNQINRVNYPKQFVLLLQLFAQTSVVFVFAPECRDIETALYDGPSVRPSVRPSVCTYVFSVLCSIFHKVVVGALQLSGNGEHKSDYGCL